MKENLKSTIDTKDDIFVKINVFDKEIDISEHTTFIHQDYNLGGSFNLNKGGDVIDVKTAELKISKKGGNPNDPYVFSSKKR